MNKEITFTESVIGSMKYLYHEPSAATNPAHRQTIRENAGSLHLVPYSHQIPDGFETLCYELGEVHHGLISLVHVFHAKRPIKAEELILLVHGIVGAVLTGTKLGLHENSFMLDPRYVYMKRNSTQPQLVYLPYSIDVPLKIGFGQLVHYLSLSQDTANPLTGQILTALKNTVTGNFNLRDLATIVVQAANSKTIEDKYLNPQKDKPADEPKGIFKRLVAGVTGSKESEAYEDPFAGFDERTVISMTDVSGIDLNVAALYVMERDARVMQIPITKEYFVLGRTRNECDHCFDEKSISRVHAVIQSDAKGYTVTDKGSSGGTFVNGARIVSNHPVPLKHGDTLELHKKKLLFECDK
ncbi:MAG: FHA domain-containing protein [Defluviitaleaceae bacterium]|nr:FHA domain-containing protein [Defluviitaleaceae bacterium]MCL2274512.1 FHA domain-containing protein [Defluviitaleaceae bacterium]